MHISMPKTSKELFIIDFHKTYKENGLTLRVIELFQKLIYDYYRNHKRKFPFREKISPYNVLISEMRERWELLKFKNKLKFMIRRE